MAGVSGATGAGAAGAGADLRSIKQHYRRLGDGGHTAIIELLKEGEVKVRLKERKSAPAPAAPAPVAPETPAT